MTTFWYQLRRHLPFPHTLLLRAGTRVTSGGQEDLRELKPHTTQERFLFYLKSSLSHLTCSQFPKWAKLSLASLFPTFRTEQVSAKTSCKGLDSKRFRLCRRYSLYHNYSALQLYTKAAINTQRNQCGCVPIKLEFEFHILFVWYEISPSFWFLFSVI